MNIENFVKKYNFVKALNNAFDKDSTSSIETVEYEVFLQENSILCEFIKVTYRGGAYNVRNVTGDSCGAIFQEVANLLFGGYYDEVEWYDKICNTYEKYSFA